MNESFLKAVADVLGDFSKFEYRRWSESEQRMIEDEFIPIRTDLLKRLKRMMDAYLASAEG